MELSSTDFDSLYRQFGPMVLRRCRFLLKDEEKAVDAMQDTFVRVLENKGRVTEVCSSYFFTIATRICLNKIRSDKYRMAASIEGLEGIIQDNASSMQEEITNVSMYLDFIFSGRDEKDREIAVLHYVDGYTIEETAKKTGMSVSGIKKRLTNLKKYAGEKHGI